ncbi:MAG: MlaD family protein [Deltaproteobacteria bacterium]|nr:MlaD family protein [Deltaproteobacteria bacterium]
MKISSEAKVGVFVLLAVIILGYLSLRVGEDVFTRQSGYLLKAKFDNVIGLVRGAPVRIAGLEIGFLETMELEDGKAVVTLRINPAVKIPRSSSITLKTQGVMGERYIEIKVRGDYADVVGEGEFLANVEPSVDLEAVFKKMGAVVDDVGAITASLHKLLEDGDVAQNIRYLVNDMASLMKRIDTLVANNEDNIGKTIEDLKVASAEMRQAFVSLNKIAAEIQEGNGTLGKIINDAEMAGQLDSTISSLSEVALKLNESKGTIGRLINDEEMGSNMEKAIIGLNKYMEKADALRTSINYRGEFLADSNSFKSYLDVKIQPQIDYFYLLGVVVNPKGTKTIRDVYTNGTLNRIEEWDRSGLLFNAMIGKRFYDIVLRGGIMESSGGVGIDYLAFDDDLKLSFEAFDFTMERKAHLKAYAEYRLFKSFYLMAGYDDWLNEPENRSVFGGFALRFDDDDLKSVLGGVSLMK